MSQNQAQLWYDFSLQQMAAESYLDIAKDEGLNRVLKRAGLLGEPMPATSSLSVATTLAMAAN